MKLVLVSLVGTAGVFTFQSAALASGGLSSTILSNTEPGLIAAPPGAFNGPITPSTSNLVMGGSNGGDTADLNQALSNGSVTAYLRVWGHQPTNGDAVVIGAFAFRYTPDEDTFLGGMTTGLTRQPGAQQFPVPGVPGAYGNAVHTTTSGIPVTEYEVTFEKGNTAFDLVVASASGDLSSADAVALATRQYAAAPDIPASVCACGVVRNWRVVGYFYGGLLVFLAAAAVISRKRGYPSSLSGASPDGGAFGGPLPFTPSESWKPPTAVDALRPKVGAE